MAENARTKIVFVIPLDFRHLKQAINQGCALAITRVSSGGFILAYVATLEPARTVHGRQPACQVTQQSQ